MAKVYIGTSGWNYKHWWNGVFYDKELKPADWLKFFSEHFNTVEINNSFYRLPTELALENWKTQVPRRFIFAMKASRFLTHIKRLKDPEAPLDLFFSRARQLKDQLGPVLFQLPPQLKIDIERLDIFLNALKERGAAKNLRCAIEVRDASWFNGDVYDRLQHHRVALCLADWKDLPVTGPVTSNFVYLRRHYGQASGGNYGKKDLDRDLERVREWLGQNLDVYMYFNNDMGGHALRNAQYIQERLRVQS